MNQLSDYKTLDYLNLDISAENYLRSRKTTSENNRIACSFKENYNHKLHSSSNIQNFEQLNAITDLLCNLSENLKTSLKKQNVPVTTSNTSENLSYVKTLVEDTFKTIKEETKKQKISLNQIENEITKINKSLDIILYGKQRG